LSLISRENARVSGIPFDSDISAAMNKAAEGKKAGADRHRFNFDSITLAPPRGDNAATVLPHLKRN